MTNDFVRVTEDLPELALKHGQVGVVRALRYLLDEEHSSSTVTVYEVDFHRVGHDYQASVLLQANQIKIENGSLR